MYFRFGEALAMLKTLSKFEILLNEATKEDKFGSIGTHDILSIALWLIFKYSKQGRYCKLLIS
jgi:hypothetical protein